MKLPNNTYPFKPKKVTVDGGHSLSYVDEGQGDVVVMLHGNPTWSFFYRKLISRLKDSHHVIAPDHLGCGLSDKPQNYPYRLENHIENLEVLLKKCQGKISLIVHDWGGAIGFGYAVRHPEKIDKLIVLNTAAFRSKRIPLRIRLCKAPFFGELLVRGLNAFAYPATFMAVVRKMEKSVQKGFLAPYGCWRDRIAVHRFVKDIPLSPEHPSYQTLLQIEQGLPCLAEKPMLILWGGQDFCFNDSYYEEWRSRFPQADARYFENAGHYILEDAYSDIEPIVERFLC